MATSQVSQGMSKEYTELARDIAVYGLVARVVLTRGSEVSVNARKLVDAYIYLFVDDEHEAKRVRDVAGKPIITTLIRYYVDVIARNTGFLIRTWETNGRREYLFDAKKLRDMLNEDPQKLVEYLEGVVANA